MKQRPIKQSHNSIIYYQYYLKIRKKNQQKTKYPLNQLNEKTRNSHATETNTQWK